MVLDPSSDVENVDLPVQNVLCLLKGIVCGSAWPGFNLVEAGCEVCRCVFCLGARGVEVGHCGVLALGEGDKFVACTLDYCEWDKRSGHFVLSFGVGGTNGVVWAS